MKPKPLKRRKLRKIYGIYGASFMEDIREISTTSPLINNFQFETKKEAIKGLMANLSLERAAILISLYEVNIKLVKCEQELKNRK